MPFHDATLSGAAARSRQKRQELEQSHREKLASIYEELLDNMRDFESREEAENEAFFKRLQTKLLLYGPTPVIQNGWLGAGSGSR